jgi:peptidyl-prolyl cis-trans isomerase B (cyclophilin B)
MKRVLILLLAAMLATALWGCAPAPEAAPVPEAVSTPEATESAEKTDAAYNGEAVTATIVVKGFGTIEAELYPDVAPQSVYNFCYLARQGFYDGLIFHRVIESFMIQGGDPDGTGMGGPGYTIKGEFAANDVENDIKHTRGVLSMARKSAPMDSAGSQFFIMHQPYPSLDGMYAAFGLVTSGIEVVDAIVAVEKDGNDKPLEDVVIESITINGPELPEPDRLQS